VIRAVFFDAGHTLLHAHPSVGEIYSEETAKLGARVTGAEFAAVFVPTFRSFVREYVHHPGSSDEQDYAMWREITHRVYRQIPAMNGIEFQGWFDRLYHRFGEPEVWKFYEDAVPTLQALRRRGLKLGVISNWDSRLRRIADGLGLTPLMDVVVISAEAGVRKPHPAIFARALNRIGVGADEAMHVGDLPEEDIEGARRAGLRPVYVDRERRDEPPPDVSVIRSLQELIPLVQTGP